MSAEYSLFEPVLEMVEKKKAQIEEALETVYSERVVEYEEDEVPEVFEREKFALSEMPLCRAVFEPGVKAPFEAIGYQAKIGKAEGFGTNQALQFTRWHNYFLDSRNSHVVCITPGQFYSGDMTFMHKGGALDQMKRDAPTHILRLSTEVAVMHGMVEELETIFNLRLIPVWD